MESLWDVIKVFVISCLSIWLFLMGIVYILDSLPSINILGVILFVIGLYMIYSNKDMFISYMKGNMNKEKIVILNIDHS
jgi:hypothetical protein